MLTRKSWITLLLALLTGLAGAQKTKIKVKQKRSGAANTRAILPARQEGIRTGAEQTARYLPLLQGKNVGLLVNHTSTVGERHLVDVLRANGVTLKVIFGPEHGFRGNAPDGAKIDNNRDPSTGVPVVSLYGKKLRPSAEDLKGVDILVYDIQDVGTRFYTFISSLQYLMEAALEQNIPLLVLDRPNPNGFYVDGPVLDPKFKSFVGMQPVPIVYGMTPGEYAHMILMEGWLSPEANEAFEVTKRARYSAGATYFRLEVIPCTGYTHKSRYALPVRPSPNLPEMQSIYWYPSTCLFEGTVLSEGRGTEKPFQYIGHPALPRHLFSFTPRTNAGAPNPKHKDQSCYGWNLSGSTDSVLRQTAGRLQLGTLLEAYRLFPQKDSFFKEATFNRLAGSDQLMQQIRAGKTEAEIRASWQPELNRFKEVRKKYLMYPDFE